jgi:putative nucleotidyltransferase with HDIG domain
MEARYESDCSSVRPAFLATLATTALSADARLQPRPWARLTERVAASTTNSDEARKAAPVVSGAVLLAIAATLLLGALLPAAQDAAIGLAALLAVVSVGADFMAFYQSRKDAVGSVALIPLSAVVLVVPDWRGVLLILVAQTITQFVNRRSLIKGAFNVAQVTLGFTVGVGAYRLLGGGSFSSLAGQGFFSTLSSLIAPTTALIVSVIAVNTLCVSLVISVVSGQKFLGIWLHSNRASAAISLLQVVIAFYLAWLSVNLGVVGAAGMVLPMIAVRQLSRTTIELTNVTEELLDLMVAAIEARDPYTSGHSKRVARASRIIAKAAGLKPGQVERVEVAALLHDVGKIDEQFARILAKEGRLTPEEWETMKRHPVRSAELVSMLTSLKDIVPAVRHHHENWDGTGYPHNLKGEEIPLASRIIMFADTLDAITTDRPYRKALGIDEARREFVKFRAKQFDPSICDLVVSDEVWQELYSSVEGERLHETKQQVDLRTKVS